MIAMALALAIISIGNSQNHIAGKISWALNLAILAKRCILNLAGFKFGDLVP